MRVLSTGALFFFLAFTSSHGGVDVPGPELWNKVWVLLASDGRKTVQYPVSFRGNESEAGPLSWVTCPTAAAGGVFKTTHSVRRSIDSYRCQKLSDGFDLLDEHGKLILSVRLTGLIHTRQNTLATATIKSAVPPFSDLEHGTGLILWEDLNAYSAVAPQLDPSGAKPKDRTCLEEGKP
jgi:hypothetical protein